MHSIRLSLPILLVTLAGVTGAAQGPTVGIVPGSAVTGRLEPTDPVLDDGSYYDLWSVRASAGEVLTITMASGDFDTYLVFGEMRGSSLNVLESNDDASGTNSQITYTVPRDGEYVIRANTLSKRETGSYTLRLESGRGSAPRSGAQSIMAGQTLTGRLDASDPVASDNSHYDEYRYQGRRGEVLVVTQRSSAFDSWLDVGRGSGGSFASIDTDDDGAGGKDSRVEITLPSDGEYVIRAGSLASNVTGAYSVGLTSGGGGGTPMAAGTRISFGQTLSGSLTSSDPLLDDGSYYDEFRFQGNAGLRVTITMRSSAFDAYLSLGQGSGRDFVSIDTDDDSAEGTDARVTITLPVTGEYVIRANSLTSRVTGAYSVAITGM